MNRACHICGVGALERLLPQGELQGVTSDCKPWPRLGELSACGGCGCVQKTIDATWRSDVASIYQQYTIYHQAGGAEQPVFTPAGQAMPRSDRLLQRIDERFPVGESGRLLDVGCGNGALLRAAARRWPGWRLAGTEIDDKYRTEVEAIRGVVAMHPTTRPDLVEGSFDLVTLVHVLEHVVAPLDLLRRLTSKVGPGGSLVVDVPDHAENPFDLVIADHASHFGVASLGRLLQRSGYAVLEATTGWIPKELSAVARPAARPGVAAPGTGDATATTRRALEWLRAVASLARALRSAGPVALFGTSIAATWLHGELNGDVDFFVDEDPARSGGEHLGRAILPPGDVPRGRAVLVALAPTVAVAALERLRRAHPSVEWHAPPPLDPKAKRSSP